MPKFGAIIGEFGAINGKIRAIMESIPNMNKEFSKIISKNAGIPFIGELPVSSSWTMDIHFYKKGAIFKKKS